MADSSVKFKIFADAAAAERAIVALEKKFGTLEQQVKRTGKASKDSNSEAIQSLVSLGERLISTTALIGFAASAWRRYAADIEAAKRAEAGIGRGAVGALATSGGLQGPARVQFLQSMKGILPEQAAAALKGVETGGPMLDVGRQTAIAKAVAALSPILAPLDETGKPTDLAALEGFGDVAAMLGDAMKGATAGDLADLTMSLQRAVGPGGLSALKSGGFERAFANLQAKGLTDEMALATLAVGVESGFAPKALLDKKNLRGLDQQKIIARSAILAQDRADDVAFRAMMTARETDPTGLGLQMGFAGQREADRDSALLGRQLDAFQQERKARATGLGRLASYLAEPLEEGVFLATQMGLLPSRNIRGESIFGVAGPTEASSHEALQQIAGLLREQTDIMKGDPGRRPQVNRHAHGE